jgi:hypothetical protein
MTERYLPAQTPSAYSGHHAQPPKAVQHLSLELRPSFSAGGRLGRHRGQIAASYARNAALRRFLLRIAGRKQSKRNLAIALLRFDAGLPVFRISALDWHQVVVNGVIRRTLSLPFTRMRNQWERFVPISPALRIALIALHHEQGCPRSGAVIRQRVGDRTHVRFIINWFGEWHDPMRQKLSGRIVYEWLPTRAFELAAVVRLKGKKVFFDTAVSQAGVFRLLPHCSNELEAVRRT